MQAGITATDIQPNLLHFWCLWVWLIVWFSLLIASFVISKTGLLSVLVNFYHWHSLEFSESGLSIWPVSMPLEGMKSCGNLTGSSR